jgi:hypothetical protein
MVTDKPKIEESADVTLLEAMKTEDLVEKADSQLALKESDMPTATSAMPPPPSPNVWNEFKTSILNLDADNPIFVLSIDTLVDMDLSTLFPELPLYEAPQPNDADAYIDELEYGRVVPITKFISQKTVIKKKSPPTRKRTAEEAFMNVDEEQDEVPQLPKHDKYDTSQYLSRKSLVATVHYCQFYNRTWILIACFFFSVVCTTQSQGYTCHTTADSTTA